MTRCLHLLIVSLLMITTQLNAQVVPAEPIASKNIIKEFFQKSLIYPTEDLKTNKSGKVTISFNIDSQGIASNHQIVSSFSDSASVVALDLVKKLLWAPATRNALPIDSQREYTVEFNAKSYLKYIKKNPRIQLPKLEFPLDSSYVIYNTKQLFDAARPYFSDNNNMASYIATNLKYPENALAREVEGTVRLRFVVETDGNISNITILKSVGGGCDNEAIRLIQQTRWIPASKDGYHVRSFVEQDITFKIGRRNFQDGNSY